MQIVRTSIIVLLLMIMANQAIAGSVRIEPPSSLFSLSVRIKDSPQDGSDPLTPDKRGIYTFEFGPKLFERSPYIRRIFVLTWTPLSEHIPARGVQPFSLEIPVLLRSWRVDDEYTIRTDGFQGIGDRWLSKYELMTNPEEQWLRLIASLQISDHYSQRIRPTVPEAGRALNTAIDSLTRISVAAPWLEIPLGLQQKIDIVLSSDSKKRNRLSQGLTNVSSLIWLDINELQAAFQGRGCDFVKAGFRELDSQKRENLAAFTLQFQSSANIYGDIQKSLLSKHCPND